MPRGVPGSFVASIFALSIFPANIVTGYLVGHKAILPGVREREEGREVSVAIKG